MQFGRLTQGQQQNNPRRISSALEKPTEKKHTDATDAAGQTIIELLQKLLGNNKGDISNN